MFYAYELGRWSWLHRDVVRRVAGNPRQCHKAPGHDGVHVPGGVVAQLATAPAAARRSAELRDRAREMPGAAAARARVAADDDRRRAAKALDNYLFAVYGPAAGSAVGVPGPNEIIVLIGDYVESRLHHKSQYGVSPWPCPRPCDVCGKPVVMSTSGHPVHQDPALDRAHEPIPYGGDEPTGVRTDDDRRASLPVLNAAEHVCPPDGQTCSYPLHDPCAGGRCPDPAAHAEGAHDV